MIGHVIHLVQWTRILGQRFFLQFGLHCATHQIRIILVSCVVITSLFYPALEIYASSQPKALSIIDTFISSSTISAFDAQKDLVDLWSYQHGLRIYDDAVSRAKCAAGRALRVERLLIAGSQMDDQRALSRRTLLSTLELENRLETSISGGDAPCLKRTDGKCFVLSPLLFWHHDREALLSDNDILDTLNTKNVTLGGVNITPQMVLARRGSHEHHVAGPKFDYATFLAVTYFFPESDCLGSAEHASWLQSVHRAHGQGPEPQAKIQEHTVMLLEYDLDVPKAEGWSALSSFLLLAYFGFFAYVAWSFGKMTAVHSRLGVTFTALVEIAVSTVTSLSVCALVGFKITMVPWELLPIVIVFVGAENMFNLVDAVGKTSVTLPVKQRIAEGLSRAGTSNTMKVVSYNAILGIIAVFWAGAIRQFCSFAVVVLVAHWFLAHTFFVAVLSIDLQRLELSELLRHDPSTLAPAIQQPSKDNHTKKPRSTWQKLVISAQSLLKGRATTNLSLLMLLAITGTLYYTIYISISADSKTRVSQLDDFQPPIVNAKPDKKPASWHIWKTLNPAQVTSLHLRIEAPNIVKFGSDSEPSSTSKYQMKPAQRFSMRTFRLALWLLKIMVLPIVTTTGLLWCLLLYLLKDTELLEAQRNRAEDDASSPQEDTKTLIDQVSFSTLPRSFASDIELIAASDDGKVVVSVGLHSEITVSRVDRKENLCVDASEILLRSASTSSTLSALTSVAVDKDGRYFAVGTGAGAIAIWTFDGDSVKPFPVLYLDNVSAAVNEVQLVSMPGAGLVLLSTYENGAAAKWSVNTNSNVTHLIPSRRSPVVKASLLRVHPLDRFFIAFSLNDGTLEVIDPQDNDPLITNEVCVQAGDNSNTASRLYACLGDLGGSPRLVVAVATNAGLITIWDASNSECIAVFDETYGHVNHLSITPTHCETCHFCGQLPLESLTIAFSVDHVIRLFRLYIKDETRRCSCSRHQPRNGLLRDNLGRRSRSNSISSQPGSASPSIPRARLATTFEASAFPVSGHGVHSRRTSEKDPGRRSLESLSVPFPVDEHDHDPRSSLSTPSLWHSAVLIREMEFTCERGGWGTDGRRIIGIRRKPRPQGSTNGGSSTTLKSTSTDGLTTATLERWELWSFDPSVSQLQCSLLATLTKRSNQDCASSLSIHSKNDVPRLPFTRVSPLFVTPTHGFAGFGNTVGIFYFSYE